LYGCATRSTADAQRTNATYPAARQPDAIHKIMTHHHLYASTARIVSTRAPVLLCLPAMGVPARFYQPMMQSLANATGGPVYTAELRGQGDSAERAERGADFGYREIVEEDLPRWIDHLAFHHAHRRIVLIGHSLGGQLAVLASAALARRLSALVLVAAGTAHHRAWPASHRLRAKLTVHAVSLAARLLPWYPGRCFGFGGNQPRRLMRDWSFNAFTGRYRMEGSARDELALEHALHDVELPVLALHMADDPVAPPGARDELLAQLPNAFITRRDLAHRAAGSAWQRHFNWARDPDAMAAQVASWLAPLHGMCPHESWHPYVAQPQRESHSHVLA
jgi:predicted alpha/beta hydrolase